MNNVGGVGKDYATTDQRMSTTMLGVSFCTNEGIMHASSLVRLSDGTDRDKGHTVVIKLAQCCSDGCGTPPINPHSPSDIAASSQNFCAHV